MVFFAQNQHTMRKSLLFIFSALMSTAAVQAQSVELSNSIYVADEAGDTLKVPVIITAKNAVNTVLTVNSVSGFGTVSMGTDVTLLTPTLTFTPTGADTLYIQYKIDNDAVAEATEYFAVELAGIVNGTIGSESIATVYIKDNDYKAPVARKNIELQHVSSYAISISGSSAEIVSYDSASNRLFVVNSLKNILHILDFSNPASITEIDTVDMSQYGGGINSVAVHDGIVAVAVQASPKTDPGKIVFLDTGGNYQNAVTAGALPDMVAFSKDGKYVISANEGEPNDQYTIDPEGSITLVDMQNGVAAASATQVTFTSFNGQENALRTLGIRIFGANNPTAAQDFEPEYVATTAGSDSVWVGLQENNAVALLLLSSKTIAGVYPLGTVDHTLPENALDVSDKTDEPLLANWPIKGLRLPDAITTYQVNGQTYLITANEGDSRDYDGYSEEERIGKKAYKLDATKFPHADLLKVDENLGRLNTTLSMGDTDNDGDYDEIYVYGGRGFSIFNTSTAALTYESGREFEEIIKADPKYGMLFNCDNDDNDPKTRSDAKGPEPEGVITGTINDTTYAFIAIERIGGIMVYDVTNPNAAVFVQYVNNRDTSSTVAGDLGSEGIIFLHKDKNPNNKHYVITANEVSGTVAVYEVKAVSVSVNNLAIEYKKLSVYPNPVNGNQLFFSETISGSLYDVSGRKVVDFNTANSINVAGLSQGIYFLQANGYQVEKVIVQ